MECPNDRCGKLDICKDEVENREGSDKPTPSGRIIRPKKPDYPTREIKRRRINYDRVQVLDEKNQERPDYPTLGKCHVGASLG